MDGMSAEIRFIDGRPVLSVNGQETPPLIYGLSDIPAWRSWNPPVQKNIANFARQGVRIVQTDSEIRKCWAEDNRLGSLDPILRDLDGVLQVEPDAAILMRIHLNAPRWWALHHPDDICVFGDTDYVDDHKELQDRLIANDLDATMRVSVASEAWLADAGRLLAKLCRALAETPQGKHVIGIQVAGGLFGEWHQWGFIQHEPDYSLAMTRRFHQFLKARYENREALRAAWHDENADFETVAIPPSEERYCRDIGNFRDPRIHQNVIDSLKCIQQSIAVAILHFAGIVKENWPRPILAGAFNGYFFNTFEDRATLAGSTEAHLLLESDRIDFLSSPFCYGGIRNVDGIFLNRNLPEALRIHGKLCLTEMDQHPIGTETIPGGDPARRGETIALLWRNLMDMLARGSGCWFYDHRIVPDGSIYEKNGWWDEPELLAEIGKIRHVFDQYAKGCFQAVADVAVVVDTECLYHLAHNPLGRSTRDEYHFARALGHSGVAGDFLYLRDIDRVDWSRYRCVIFANTVLLTTKQREFIDREIARNGRSLVWVYASGFANGPELDDVFIRNISGISVTRIPATENTRLTFHGCGLPDYEMDVPPDYDPLFAVDDPDVTPAARFSSGAVAAARKLLDDHISWFLSLPADSFALVREIARQAGAHVYSPDGDAMSAGSGILSFTSVHGGPRTIALRNGKMVKTEFAPLSTNVFDAETGERVL